jgi:hypothetical protein
MNRSLCLTYFRVFTADNKQIVDLTSSRKICIRCWPCNFCFFIFLYLKWMSLIICWAEEVTFSLSCWDRWLNTSWLSRSHGSLGTSHNFHIHLHRYHCNVAEISSSGFAEPKILVAPKAPAQDSFIRYLDNCLF